MIVSLNQEQLGTILQALDAQPHKQVRALIDYLLAEYNTQLAAEQKANQIQAKQQAEAAREEAE